MAEPSGPDLRSESASGRGVRGGATARSGGAPLVSVVVAAYQAEATLGATLRSILDQTHRELEVIVVDDGSTDATSAVAEGFAEIDDRVRPVRIGHNVGRSAARNRGLDLARGVWVCPADADDLWARWRLREFFAAARRFGDVEAFTDDLIEFFVGSDGSVSLGHRYVSRVSWWLGPPHRLSLDTWFRDRECHMRAFIRRDLLDRHGIRFPVDLSAGEDLAFYLQVAFARGTPAPVRVARPNYYYRSGESVRAANMAESRVRMGEIAVAATGSRRLAELVAQTDPERVFMYRRADRIWAERGRSGERDPGSDEVELRMDRIAGCRRLVLNRLTEVLGRLADHRIRPSIVADVERQLAAPLPVRTAGGRAEPVRRR
ncbi:MAG: glycosyltransferase family 2 protein [Microthrixaceae bacterium]